MMGQGLAVYPQCHVAQKLHLVQMAGHSAAVLASPLVTGGLHHVYEHRHYYLVYAFTAAGQ